MPYGAELLGARLRHQLLEPGDLTPSHTAGTRDPAGVVDRLCAVQAQDYYGALWSVGLRCSEPVSAADIEHALATGRIVRTWPMRGTLHFVSPHDARWMTALLSPRVLNRARGRYEQLGITPDTVAQARTVVVDALAGGNALAREQIMALLEADGISTDGQRGYHLLWTLAQQLVLCFGPPRGRQQTFVLLDEWVPTAPEEQQLEPAAALARLAERYFVPRGPATIADFAWWAGITKAEARLGVSSAAGALKAIVVQGSEYWMASDAPDPLPKPEAKHVLLLPGFDEYFLGYTDRTAQLGSAGGDYGSTVSANGMFSPTLVVGGRVAGTWKRTLRRKRVDIAVTSFRPLTAAEKRGLSEAADRYGFFVGLPANLKSSEA